MGFFSSIGRAVREGQEKARMEAMELSDRIDKMELIYACYEIEKELKAGSLSKRTSTTAVFNKKLKQTDNRDELFFAFNEMYRRGKMKNDGMWAMNIAQRIGKKLYEMNDARVESNSDNTYFKPKY